MHLLMYELYTNTDARRDRVYRELILATDLRPTNIVGYAFLVYRKNSVYIQLLEACFKGHGIGSMLLQHCIRRAKESGVSFIELVSLDSGKTLAFYEKHGFERGPYGSRSPVKPTQWQLVDYSDSNDDEKKEGLPKLHLKL